MAAKTIPSRALTARPELPEHKELEQRFNRVLNCMDLPADKVKLLRSYDDHKKWELILDEEKVSAKQPPEYYLKQLRQLLESSSTKLPKREMKVSSSTSIKKRLSRSFRLKKSSSDMSSTQVLRDLEISLRTNSIHWVRDFLGDQHKGLDVLVTYLSHALDVMRADMGAHNNVTEMTQSQSGGIMNHTTSSRFFFSSIRRPKPSTSRFGLADSIDDIHIGVQCLRDIMNHQHGFNLVFQHKEAINLIALSLLHNNYRTRTLVLELLAAVCLVSGGHEIIFMAFDRFKEVCGEKKRFETLMHRFMYYDHFHIDFMVACMQFLNIAAHSVEDMNYRVHLQHEFSLLGLDAHLERLMACEGERLQTHVGAYMDNRIDVAALLEDADQKVAAVDRAMDLDLQVSHLKEEAARQEDLWMKKTKGQDEKVKELKVQFNTLKKEKEQEVKDLHEALVKATKIPTPPPIPTPTLSTPSTPLQTPFSATPAPPPPPPPPPPLLPLPPICGGPPPPPPPPFPSSNPQSVTIKKVLQPQQRLPVLNWTPMKPHQATTTVFASIDDQTLYETIDWTRFEEMFKLGGGGGSQVDGAGTPKGDRRVSRKPEQESVLETNRLRNVAISKRKIELSNEEVVQAIQNLDLQRLPLENVEAVWRMIPTEQEVKLLKQYQQQHPSLHLLCEEDTFLLALTQVARLQQRLQIMTYVGNFHYSLTHLLPQLKAIKEASLGIKKSSKLKKVLQVLLALGNYMNASKRGPAYGFKLHSFDAILELKAADKKQTLMHFLVDTFDSHFPSLCSFPLELPSLDDASAICLENVRTDVKELEKGMSLVKKELEGTIDKCSKVVGTLEHFVGRNEEGLVRVCREAQEAQEAFEEVLRYFGESSKSATPSSFFSIFSRLVKSFSQALNDVRSRVPDKEVDLKKQQQVLVSEMKRKYQEVPREKRVISREEVYHGALEDILLDLKNEPFRRADGVRRNNRSKANNNNHTHNSTQAYR